MRWVPHRREIEINRPPPRLEEGDSGLQSIVGLQKRGERKNSVSLLQRRRLASRTTLFYVFQAFSNTRKKGL